MKSISKQDVRTPFPGTANTRPPVRNAAAPASAPRPFLGQAAASAQRGVLRDYNRDTFTAARRPASLASQPPAGLAQLLQKGTSERADQTAMDDSGRAVDAPSGAEAAARLQDEDNYIGQEGTSFRAQDFLATVEAHKDDPAFLEQLYAELGPELTSELLGDAVGVLNNDNRNLYPTEADAQRAMATVAQTIDAMPADFQQQVGRTAGEHHPDAAMILEHCASQEAKLGFLEGVKPAALGSGDDAGFAARMAGQIIASDPQVFQQVADTWSAGDLSTLLKNGLAEPPYPLDRHSQWPSFSPDGLERMVGMTADLEGEQYADLRTRVFRDAALALEGSPAGSEARESLVDNLKTLFQSDAQGINSRLFNNNTLSVGQDSPYDSTQKALGLFLRDALFAPPGKDPAFNEFISNFMGDLRGQMFDPNTPHSQNELAAKQLGDVLGSLVTGYVLAVKDNGEEQATRQAFVDTLVGLAMEPISVGGGPVGGRLKSEAEALISDVLGKFINGDLKAEQEDMEELMGTLIDFASSDTRDFDTQYGTNLETNMKTETMWVDFIRELLG